MTLGRISMNALPYRLLGWSGCAGQPNQSPISIYTAAHIPAHMNLAHQPALRATTVVLEVRVAKYMYTNLHALTSSACCAAACGFCVVCRLSVFLFSPFGSKFSSYYPGASINTIVCANDEHCSRSVRPVGPSRPEPGRF
jgi:hypothetical protein